jgi:imidazolonepropionase
VTSSGLRLLQGGRAADGLPGLLVENASEVATLTGGLRVGSRMDDPALLTAPGGDWHHETAPAVAAWDGRVLATGPRNDLLQALEGSGYPAARFARLDAQGGTVTPGLIDPHTHLLFAGSRENELVLRQQGADYLEILQAGGGILSTVAATRAATEDQLLEHGRRWLGEMLAHGTTTIEAKSGYGLDLPTELRLLEVAHRLGREGPIEVQPTWLGAHAVAPEFRARPDGTEAYVRHLLEEQLPGVAAQGRAKFADVFCERGVFSPAQARRVLTEAARLGLQPRIHADELAPSGGAEVAAEVGAFSADHLAAPSQAGIDALAAAAGAGRPVVAVLLPTVSWFLMHEETTPARTFIDRGVPVALATDFNPGTSPTASLPFVLTVACLTLKLTPSEALAAVTVNAAAALGIADEVGSIESGRQADLAIWSVPTHRQIPYWPAADLIRAVVKRGIVVLERESPG